MSILDEARQHASRRRRRYACAALILVVVAAAAVVGLAQRVGSDQTKPASTARQRQAAALKAEQMALQAQLAAQEAARAQKKRP
jgi:Tfp pilus assembly protein PilN